MNNKAYASTDKLDVEISVKESPLLSTSTNSESLRTRYIQIGIAVALYW